MRGLAALAPIPLSAERDAQDLKLTLLLGMAQMATCGFAAPA